jgi:hypothetical protein
LEIMFLILPLPAHHEHPNFGIPSVAGMTSVHHQAQLLIEMVSHKPFCLQ